ncbi:MAG: hypothetical protein PHQ04_10545 [Opitutaceae bacterium]|nr:hypothetical protein [Opitutaceae bacterium]
MHSVIIHWPYLLLAILCLWFPRHWLRLGYRLVKIRRRHRNTVERFAESGAGGDPYDKTVRLARELRSKRNYIDFFRGMGGAYALIYFSFTMTTDDARTSLLVVQAVIILIGTLVQSLRFGKTFLLFAPLFYIFGAGLAVAGLVAGGFAMLLAGALNLLMPTPRSLLGLYGLLLLGFSLLFPVNFLRTLLFAVIALLPALMSLLLNRSLITHSHKIRM